jgi:DnaK suppressor protein
LAKKASQKATKNVSGRKTRPSAGAASGATKALAKKKARPPAATPRPKVAARAKPPVARNAKAAGGTARAGERGKTPGVLHRPAPAVVETVSSLGPQTRGERALTHAEIEEFRRMLLEKRAEILGDVSTLHNEALNKDRRDAAGDLSSMPIHMADLGSDNYELEFTLGLIEGERAILKEIDEALERMQQGTYGLCLATGRPIGKARLRAKPWAKYSYEYTLAQEQGQTRRV